MEHFYIRLIYILHPDITNVGYGGRISQCRLGIHNLHSQIFEEKRCDSCNPYFLIGHIIREKLLQIFLIDLCFQTLTHSLQYFFKCVIFLGRMELCRYHYEEILRSVGSKIRTQVYRNCHTDRFIRRHSLETFLIYTVYKHTNEILINADTIFVTYFL